MNSTLRLVPVIAVAAVGVSLAVATWVRRHRKTPEQRERERRLRISGSGRITDGTVIDVSEMELNGSGELQLLIYQYDVAGVSYEASQDVTHLRHMVDLHTCRVGLPASIKYDPANPGNSIVIAENWTGLRH
ncbi:MAG TPA: hypothetical protein VKY85_18350 [Candidatus Angelobacter sp.]|jgi:hypothetical protein|nr:hypothetical protein [Candidatus Angelobacter sp.]